MIFNKFSITFDEIKYNQEELKNYITPFVPTQNLLIEEGTGGKCSYLDVKKYEGLELHEYPYIQRLCKLFSLYDEELEQSNWPIKLFAFNENDGIPPHVDASNNCAIIFPIIPIQPDPVIYLDQGHRQSIRGQSWPMNEFNLSEIVGIHQYIPGYPSLISSYPHIHAVWNYNTNLRIILRFKISVRTFEECVEMCKNNTFINANNLEKFKLGIDY